MTPHDKHDKEAVEREEFEHWASSGWYSGVSLEKESGGAYRHPGVQNDWTVWQARAALSAPAPVAEQPSEQEPERESGAPGSVYKVTFPGGESCHFGHRPLAVAYARGKGKVEEIRLRDFKVVRTEPVSAPAQAGDYGFRPMLSAPQDGTEIELLIYHTTRHMYAEKDRENWEQIVVGKWIDFNGGGWTWQGMAGSPVGWRAIEARNTDR